MNTDLKFLIVDDQSVMRDILSNILEEMGFKQVFTADDGTKAIEILKNQEIDMVISDWVMPEMTGIELLKHIRETPELENLPFIMITTEAQKENIINAVKLKVSNYIVKPFTPEIVKEKIQAVIAAISETPKDE